MTTPPDPRPSPIAGQWYPGHPQRLAESIDSYLQAAQLPPLPGQVVAVIAPHAGHRYSGPVAGHAFAALRGLSPSLVAVISPMHRPYQPPLLTSAHSAYATPLGHIPIDRPAVQALDQALRARLGFGLTPIRLDEEHSLEIELPFLQRVLPKGFSLLPIMLRDQSAPVCQTLGECLAQTLQTQNALLVASSDLSHFYPQPIANRLDREMLRRIAAFDPLAVLQAEEQGQAFACGRAAIAAVLWAAQSLQADTVTLLHYATSGDVTGDHSQVVGYGAAAITKKSD